MKKAAIKGGLLRRQSGLAPIAPLVTTRSLPTAARRGIHLTAALNARTSAALGSPAAALAAHVFSAPHCCALFTLLGAVASGAFANRRSFTNG